MKTTYQIVVAENPGSFDRACNILAKDEWSPVFSMCVVMSPFPGEEPITKYVQQWMKPEQS